MNQAQTHGIMRACEYSIATLTALRKQLSLVDSKNKAAEWALGGLVIVLSSNLLRICDDVLSSTVEEASAGVESSAKNDILAIQNQFNQFIAEMLGNV
jgi:hypothetical protein